VNQMERTEKGYRLSTGREVYAHRGLIGISVSDRDSDEDSHGFEISEGYDGHLDVNGHYDYVSNGVVEAWTEAEKLELADFMIQQWQAFREKVTALRNANKNGVVPPSGAERG